MKNFVILISLFLIMIFSPVALALPDNGIVINISSKTLDLYKNGKPVKTYSVAVGRASFPTPIGSFRIIRIETNPGWENPYKDKGKIRIKAGNTNPLGTRWIGFKDYAGGEYGIHGTNQPSSVGKSSSHGCVRMFIKDSEELFNYVSVGMPVIIINKKNNPKNNIIKLTVGEHLKDKSEIRK